MEIVESWEDHHGQCYAIVQHSEQDWKKWGGLAYEAMWLDPDGEMWSFGGSVGFRTADYDTLEEARDFLLKGITEFDKNPEIWWDMCYLS